MAITKEKLMSFKLDEELNKDLNNFVKQNKEMNASRVIRIALREYLNQSPVMKKTGKKS